MNNRKDLINAISTIFTMSTPNTGKTEKNLAKFILENYYGVETFFLNRENDFSSGLNELSVMIFSDNMRKVIKSINGEL